MPHCTALFSFNARGHLLTNVNQVFLPAQLIYLSQMTKRKKIISDVMFTVLSEGKKTDPNFLTSHTCWCSGFRRCFTCVPRPDGECWFVTVFFLDLFHHFYSCVSEQHYCFTAAHTYSDWFLHQKHQCAFKKLDHHHNLIIRIIRIKGSYDKWERHNTFGILPKSVEKI